MDSSDIKVHEQEKEWLTVLNASVYYPVSEKENALKYARNNFMTIIRNNDFLGLGLDIFVELLRSDDLIVDSEITVYQSVKRWIDYNLSDPSKVLNKLLKAVRLTLLPDEYLIDVVLPYISLYEESHSYVSETLHWKLSTSRRACNERTKSRKNPDTSSKCMLAVGSGDFSTSKTIEIYDSSKTWRRLKDIDIPTRNHAAAILEDKLVIVGGLLQHSVNSVYEINIESGAMRSLNPMNSVRHNIPLVIVKGKESSKMYTFGGRGYAGESLNTAEVYDTKTKRWSYISPMAMKRNGVGAALHGNRIYVVGGYDDESKKKSNSLDFYDIKNDSWHVRSPMVQPREYCSAVVLGDYLYALAGYDRVNDTLATLNSVEKYDIINDIWIPISNLVNSGYIGAGIYDNSLVVVGGSNSKVVEKYDTKRNVWNKFEPLNVAREIVNVVPLPSKFDDIPIDW